MRGFGQFCPIALALEVVGERWTLLIIRELKCGSHRFSDIQRGVPLMSKSVLSQRLRALLDAGVLERRGGEYHLTQAGHELGPIVMACGEWGTRWAYRKMKDDEVDVALLMWDMRRRIDSTRVDESEVMVQFEFRGAPRGKGRYWLHIAGDQVDLCLTNPRRDVDLRVTTSPKTMAEVWLGEQPISQAIRSGALSLDGPRRLVRAFPNWLQRSVFADVERADARAAQP